MSEDMFAEIAGNPIEESRQLPSAQKKGEQNKRPMS